MQAQKITLSCLLFFLALLTPALADGEVIEYDSPLVVSSSPADKGLEIIAPDLDLSFFSPSIKELLTPPISAARVNQISAGEAAKICRSPAWALTPENWIFSGSKEFLDAYTVATEGSYARKKYGLIGSLAFHYLGEENFRCSISMMQSCVVSCKDVVMAVDDLEEAKLAYFVLSSVSHFGAVAELIHVSISLWYTCARSHFYIVGASY